MLQSECKGRMPQGCVGGQVAQHQAVGALCCAAAQCRLSCGAPPPRLSRQQKSCACVQGGHYVENKKDDEEEKDAWLASGEGGEAAARSGSVTSQGPSCMGKVQRVRPD